MIRRSGRGGISIFSSIQAYLTCQSAASDLPAAWGSPGGRAVEVLAVFVIANLFSFNSLHPKNWARVTSTLYDYGFYYQENEGGRKFRWTGEKAGIYIYLDQHDCNSKYTMVCGAPLSHLPSKRQIVDVYWRGRFLKSVIFRDNGHIPLQIEDHDHRKGFLEVRVRPACNLKRMELGLETRDLGIQLSGGDQ